MPAIFVGISVGPGCQWARSYKVVPLASLLSEDRASRVSIRTVADLIFPEVCSFPLQQRLTLHGAYEDTTLLAPMVTDETEHWAVIEEGGDDDLLRYDGICNENAPKFRKTKVIEVMMAIDPDIGPEGPDDEPDVQEAANEVILAHDFAAVEPDVADVAELGSFPAADEAAEIISDGRAPPTGWRRDDFPPDGPVRRTVWAPPWSLRPPNIEPEEWLSQNQKHKDSLREEWKLRDPVGFAKQEERRRLYKEMKMKGKVKKTAAVAMPALACKWFLDTVN